MLKLLGIATVLGAFSLAMIGGAGLVQHLARAYEKQNGSAQSIRRSTAEKLDRIVTTRSGASQFFIGLFNFTVLFVVAVVCGKLGPLKILTLGILSSLVALTFLGFTARLRSARHCWGRCWLVDDCSWQSF